MEISGLKPCAVCGGPIIPSFNIVKITRMDVDIHSLKQTLGLNQFFGGHALGLAEVFSPGEAANEKETKEFVVCDSCIVDDSLAIFLKKSNP